MKIKIVGTQGNNSLHVNSSSEIHVSSISTNESHVYEWKRSEMFHIRFVYKHTKIDTLFDPSSQVNLISKLIVKKLGMETKTHPKRYPLG